jgi:hypothetical protein
MEYRHRKEAAYRYHQYHDTTHGISQNLYIIEGHKNQFIFELYIPIGT